MWELVHKEGGAPKNWCFWTVMLEKALESALDSKEIKPVNPKGNQCWIFIGRTAAEAPMLWPLDAKSLLIEKDPDAGKDWGQEEKGTTEDEMVGSHHRLNGHEFEHTLKDSEGQGILACYSPWGHKELDTTEPLNSNRNVLWTFSPILWFAFIFLTMYFDEEKFLILTKPKLSFFSPVANNFRYYLRNLCLPQAN